MKTVIRDRLFWDQFQYSVGFIFRHSHCMRGLDVSTIPYRVQRQTMFFSRGTVEAKPLSEIVEQAIDLTSAILSAPGPYKHVVGTNYQYVYSNDLTWLIKLSGMPGVINPIISKASVELERDAVVLNHSDYSWRSYFSDVEWQHPQLPALKNFLEARSDYFRITPTLANRFKSKHFYPGRWHFIDHHSDQDVLMLNLVLPGIIRKTVPIRTRQHK